MDIKSLESIPKPTQYEKEKGKICFRKPPVFTIGAAAINDLPEENTYEIAFAGRSNVGKSSLINALCQNNTIAKISATPGRTRQLNFFKLHNGSFIVDMPGYGYARAKRQDAQKWQNLIKTYLKGRQQLRRVMLLIDARRNIMKTDQNVMQLMDENAVNYQIIITKIDKLSANQCEKIKQSMQKKIRNHPAAHPHIHLTSAHKQIGLDALRTEIALCM